MERSTFLWYAPAGRDERRDLARRLLSINCEAVHVKAFGDGGVAWVPGEPPPGFRVQPQWSLGWIKDFAPLHVNLWGYNKPGDLLQDADAACRALRHYWPDDDLLILNPEVEWWGVSNDEAAGYVQAFRHYLRQTLGRAPRIGFSSCPSWHRFPYEGFAAECDGPSYPQHYWPDRLMAPDHERGAEAGEDQVEAHMRRAPGVRQVPIITTSREYVDPEVIGLAVNALADDPGLLGFSAWEAGNDAFQIDALAAIFRLLPDDTSTPDVHESGIRLDGGFRAFYRDYGRAALQLFGLPLTGEQGETVNGIALTAQWFERARFEHHPGSGAPHDVILGRLGAERLGL